LFDGALTLPTLAYYKRCLDKLSPKKVVIISEPDDVSKYGSENPVPGKIIEYCNDVDIQCQRISGEDVFFDAGVVFWAKRVICSTSAFAQSLALFSRDCEEIYMPLPLKADQLWIQDDCIEYIDAWERFCPDKWQNDLEYRLAWVLGKC